MIRVSIVSLPEGLHEETLHPSAADAGLDPDVFRDIEVDVRLDLRDRRVLTAFTVRALARLECDRTLEMYDEPVSGTYSVLFVAAGDPMADDPDDEAVQPLAGDALFVDLTEPVRDTLLLALPLRRVSPAARDLEIPTAYGSASDDDLADDRWDALRALRDADLSSQTSSDGDDAS